MKKIVSLIIGSVLLFVLTGCKDPKQANKTSSSTTSGDVKTLKCQTVLNTKADEVKMLKDFTDTVTVLTGGSLKFERVLFL